MISSYFKVCFSLFQRKVANKLKKFCNDSPLPKLFNQTYSNQNDTDGTLNSPEFVYLNLEHILFVKLYLFKSSKIDKW